jgi:hypothetical protein
MLTIAVSRKARMQRTSQRLVYKVYGSAYELRTLKSDDQIKINI